MQYDLVAIVSAPRGMAALRHLLSELPSTFSTPILCLVQSGSGLLQDLQSSTRMKVRWAERGAHMERGTVYLSRPGTSVMCMPDGTLGLSPFGAESSALNPMDNFLLSAATVHGGRVLTLVLAGFDRDGVEGCDHVKRAGGTVLVLDLLRCAEIQIELAALLETALRMSGTMMGHITRRARGSDKLCIIVQRGLDIDFFEHFEGLPADRDTAWCRAVRLKQPVLIPDVAKEPDYPGHGLERLPYRAEYAVPLLLSELALEAHGALTTLYRHAPSHYESADLDQIAREAAGLVTRIP